MTQELERIFRELGVAQYLDAFVDQGFDTWDTILDIQESDLDALGVKLGHRRKLQRRIANARGVAPSISLASSVKAASEDTKSDTTRRDSGRTDVASEVVSGAKRKYRRHPKPDENAPERPPSAYVLFSNKMREDVKGQNLTFTEIAKLVGENWQSLAPGEKESYESQANVAKEKYHRDLAEYKKTSEYRRYQQYLQDFKERQAKHSQVHDSVKRPKIETARIRHGSTSSGSATRATTSCGSGSSSERILGSEPPRTRRHRENSITSMTESQHSSAAPTPLHRTSIDDIMPSPRSTHFEATSPRESRHRHSRRPSHSRRLDASHQQNLPSLSDMLDDGRRGAMPSTGPADGNPYANGPAPNGHRQPVPDGPSPLPPATRRPFLHHESSSNGSSGSGSSTGSFSRAPGEGPLPIHALLSNRDPAAPVSAFDRQPSMVRVHASGPEQGSVPFDQVTNGPRGYGFQSASSPFQKMRVEQSGDGDVLMTSVDATPSDQNGRGKDGFDGMTALLRAGEIVGRRNRD